MNKAINPQNIIEFLEELRSIAQLGLNYTKDPYDCERYERLLELKSIEYSKLTEIPMNQITEQFKKELGHITPKVGVDASIFSDNGHILLMKRSDDKLWCLPCGWAELGETPQEAIKREILEETCLKVEVGKLIDIFTRLPGEFGQPHTAYFLSYHCIAIGGTVAPTSEALELGFYDHTKCTAWHRDHQKRAERAYQFWLHKIKGNI